jgi:glycogen phosphorylase
VPDIGSPLVAYFSMEIGLESGMPTYSGGLGVLAGDTIRSAADLEVPMVAVSLIHRRGHFFQRVDVRGQQSEEPVAWPINDFADLINERVTVDIEGRTVHIRAWRYRVKGESGHVVPVYLLDTDVNENQLWDRTLTDVLYGAMTIIACVRRWCWGSGDSACCGRSDTRTFSDSI